MVILVENDVHAPIPLVDGMVMGVLPNLVNG